jgi:N-acetylglucosaminyl-diphospho-decaprenol L-rhamnosyltransferase
MNYGFCIPNNLGAKSAKGEFVAFLNNDTVVTREWLRELVSNIRVEPDVKCVASKILFADRRNVVNSAGGKLSLTGAGFYIGYGDNDSSVYSRSGHVGFGCGAAVLVEKRFFLDSGGFDSDYFASGEEHDLGWRTWLFGGKVVYAPRAVVYHWESVTLGHRGSLMPAKVYYVVRNRLFTLVKNAGTAWLVKGIILSVAFDTYRAILHIRLSNRLATSYICLAYVAFLKSLRQVLSKRRSTQARRRRSDSELRKLGVMANLGELVREERRLLRVMTSTLWRAGEHTSDQRDCLADKGHFGFPAKIQS